MESRTFKDDYEKALKALITRKLSGKKITAPKASKPAEPSNVIDLVAILQKSLNQKGTGTASSSPRKTASKKEVKTHAKSRHRKAA